MSCDWDVYCRDCNETLGVPDANHAVNEMRALVKIAKRLVGFEEILSQFNGVEYSYYHVNLGWLAKHGGHQLVARDEYGHCDDECGEYFYCKDIHCGHQQQCTSKIGHEGAHSRPPKLPE